jgi:hypothetical protein
VHGSGTLTRWLLENDLVDEMNRSSARPGARSMQPTETKEMI